MPTYDYQCQKCGHKFEHFQSMSSDRLTDCPEDDCDGQVKRLLGTGAGIIFKGGGFYETDYRSDSYNAAKKADTASSSESKSSSGDKKKKSSTSDTKKSSSSGSDSKPKKTSSD